MKLTAEASWANDSYCYITNRANEINFGQDIGGVRWYYTAAEGGPFQPNISSLLQLITSTDKLNIYNDINLIQRSRSVLKDT